MSIRRLLLAASALAWLGMMGALAYREHARKPHGEAAEFIESIFGENAPLFTSRSIWLQDPLSPEKEIGYIETENQRTGANDVRVITTVEVRARDLPPQAAAVIQQLFGSSEDFKAEIDARMKREGGLQRLSGYATWGTDRWDFQAPRKGEYLKLSTAHNGRWGSESRVPYDQKLPFGGGVSPFAGVKSLKVGDTWEVTQLNPLDRRPLATRITVDREESITYKDKTEKCFVLGSHPSGGAGEYGLATATAWVTPDGRLLREEMQLLIFKLALVLESTVSAKEPPLDPSKPRPRKPPPATKGTVP